MQEIFLPEEKRRKMQVTGDSKNLKSLTQWSEKDKELQRGEKAEEDDWWFN